MPVVESTVVDLEGNGNPFTVQGWDDGGTTVVRDGQVFMSLNGPVPIDGWHRNPSDAFFAADVDHDGKQEVFVFNNNDKWTGLWKWQGAPAQLHTVWGSPSPITGPAGNWNRRADTFATTTYHGQIAIAVTSPPSKDMWWGTLAWTGAGLELVILTQTTATVPNVVGMGYLGAADEIDKLSLVASPPLNADGTPHQLGTGDDPPVVRQGLIGQTVPGETWIDLFVN